MHVRFNEQLPSMPVHGLGLLVVRCAFHHPEVFHVLLQALDVFPNRGCPSPVMLDTRSTSVLVPREVLAAHAGLAIGIGCGSASFQVVRFSFVDHHEVSHFDHTSLDALDVVTRATDQHEYEHVNHASDSHLTLSDPDRFDQDQVVSGGFAELNGF